MRLWIRCRNGGHQPPAKRGTYCSSVGKRRLESLSACLELVVTCGMKMQAVAEHRLRPQEVPASGGRAMAREWKSSGAVRRTDTPTVYWLMTKDRRRLSNRARACCCYGPYRWNAWQGRALPERQVGGYWSPLERPARVKKHAFLQGKELPMPNSRLIKNQ